MDNTLSLNLSRKKNSLHIELVKWIYESAMTWRYRFNDCLHHKLRCILNKQKKQERNKKIEHKFVVLLKIVVVTDL